MTDQADPDQSEERSGFERFEDLTHNLVQVPKSEIDKARAREEAAKALRKEADGSDLHFLRRAV